jgi:hypothetical protein
MRSLFDCFSSEDDFIAGWFSYIGNIAKTVPLKMVEKEVEL